MLRWERGKYVYCDPLVELNSEEGFSNESGWEKKMKMYER